MVEKYLINQSIEKAIQDITLKSNEIIESEKCKPKYIQSLPGDMRSNNETKLQNRKNTVNTKIKETNEKIKELKKSKTYYTNSLEKDSDNIKKQSSELDKHLENIFTDYFGEPGTDKPQKIINDIRLGGNKRDANAMERFINDINKFHDDIVKFDKKLTTALDKKSKPDSINKIMKSFNKKFRDFAKKDYEYSKKYGSGGYLGDSSASREMSKIYDFFDYNTVTKKYTIMKGYESSYRLLDNTKNDLKKQNTILKDYKNELKRINEKLS